LLYEIFAEFYKENKKLKNINPIIEKAVLYIKSNYTSPDISVKTASGKSNISEVYFRKLFKEEFGVSPRKYIIASRIKYAEGLIATGYYSLQEIAFMSGFTDYKYFSVEFKKLMGDSPSKYGYNYSE
jgi:AraC-like DNA-binding protein